MGTRARDSHPSPQCSCLWKQKYWAALIPHSPVHSELVWPQWALERLRCYMTCGQYSQSVAQCRASASARRVPAWSPRRYLPFFPLIATRPHSRNSKKKSSDISPSLHTVPLLATYQNLPLRPRSTKETGVIGRYINHHNRLIVL